MRKPIIASISGETKNLINNANCGLVSEAEDYEGLAKKYKRFHKID